MLSEIHFLSDKTWVPESCKGQDYLYFIHLMEVHCGLEKLDEQKFTLSEEVKKILKMASITAYNFYESDRRFRGINLKANCELCSSPGRTCYDKNLTRIGSWCKDCLLSGKN